MASRRKIMDHSQLAVTAAILSAVLLAGLKFALRRAGRSDLANDL